MRLVSLWLASLAAAAVSASELKAVTLQGTITKTDASASVPTGSYISYDSTIMVSETGDRQQASHTGTAALSPSDSADANSTEHTVTRTRLETTVVFLTGGAKSTKVHTGTVTMTQNGTMNATSTSSSSAELPTNTQACNGYPEFCSRKYSNITEVCAHNSPFVKANSAAANQAFGVTTQLNDGIRMLQAQTHFNATTKEFNLCHTNCELLNAGTLVDYLTTVREWVAAHPYDVVTVLLENAGYVGVENYTAPIEDSGLKQYLYEPPKIPMGLDDWPTLTDMILATKRVVLFLDYQANQTAVPYILDQFSQMWESPFDPTDRTFPCTVQRPPNLAVPDAKARMYMINHNLNAQISVLGTDLLVPNTVDLEVTNSNKTENGSLELSAEQCTEMWGRPPNRLNVDYYNYGNFNGSVFAVAAKYNNVTYNDQCCGSTSTSGAAGLGGDSAAHSFIAAALSILLVAFAML
ncbi:uncharacterized protein K452DRAFT_226630 [Aplosporella prunicola CBS 121167]|uniref:PLC-like phosphodiesterase n=1 Tax=Aplosporella prunicola CBS 121167 TaxID=1176127 RepID=A0A6A6BGP1_9PEZI|nr:uncharacterized protein K452DRAFT_226630 [Aplosporella prunicola CBS 121167]KAF2142593.1 hypothetical protein K452DRAFT_226630 [Aplosporella prunicola CBS 121167]